MRYIYKRTCNSWETFDESPVIIILAKPIKLFNSLRLAGVGKFLTNSILQGSGKIPYGVKTWPKYSIRCFTKLHFFGFNFTLASRNLLQNSSKCVKCSSIDLEKITMSSIYINANLYSNPRSIWAIRRWKLAHHIKFVKTVVTISMCQ